MLFSTGKIFIIGDLKISATEYPALATDITLKKMIIKIKNPLFSVIHSGNGSVILDGALEYSNKI